MSGQDYLAWFTTWPSTHKKAGETVEVVPRAVLEDGRVECVRLRKALTRLTAAVAARRGGTHHRGNMSLEWDDEAAGELLDAHDAAMAALGESETP